MKACPDMAKRVRRVSGDRTDRTWRTDVQQRLADVEELARANRRELELQFRRMAEMQVEIDALKKKQ